MTDFTLSAGNYIRPFKCPWGAFPMRSMKLSTGISSNIIRVGTVVQLDANSTSYNDCIVPVAQSSNSLNPTAATVVGVSAEAPGAVGGNTGLGSTNAQGTVISVYDGSPMVEFKAWTYGGLLNSTIVGQPKELHRDTTLNIDVVHLGASSLATPAKCVIITGLIDASGDSGGAVSFKFGPISSGFMAFYR